MPVPAPSVPTTGATSTPTPSDTTPPLAPVITVPLSDHSIATSTTLLLQGTAEPNTIITASLGSSTTTVTSGGDWSFSVTGLSQGTTTIGISATDAAGNASATSSRTVFVDSIGPEAILSIPSCAQSLSTSGCLIATTTFAINWSSSTNDLAHYSVSCANAGSPCPAFPISTTTATSTVYTAPSDETTYTFIVNAVDTNGNTGVATSTSITVFARPVIINEVAWAGTGTSSADEWIELYNRTDRIISFAAGWTLDAADGVPALPLSGTIGARGYYLIERGTDNAAISDIIADLAIPFSGNGSGSGLSNQGETLLLSFASTTMDQTVLCNNQWCGGSSGNPISSMERVDPNVSGAVVTNWVSSNGIVQNGKDANGNALTGTPRARNSANYLLTTTGAIAQNLALASSSSPYLIAGDVTVATGVTLTIPTGVVVKFVDTSASLMVNGILDARGTIAFPIVFTSFKDDAYGGDTNGDATSTTPQAGDWKTIRINGNGSILEHTIIKYGGLKDSPSQSYANVRVENASTTIAYSTISDAKVYGLILTNATGTSMIGNTVTRNNNDAAGAGILISGANPAISSNSFTENTEGINITNGGTPLLANNTFTGNTGLAVNAIGAMPVLSGNTATGNGLNGIQVQGTLVSDRTLSANLPYVLTTTLTVASGTTLTIPAGTVLKFASGAGVSIKGMLAGNGTAGATIVFTSLQDDTAGGDTNNDGSTTVPAAGNWSNLFFDASSGTSTLTSVIVRYGGPTALSDYGAVRVRNAGIALRDSTITQNYGMGMRMENSSGSVISGSTFISHQTPASSYALFLVNSSVNVSNTTFSQNVIGIQADGTSSVINNGGIVFIGNVTDDEPGTLVE